MAKLESNPTKHEPKDCDLLKRFQTTASLKKLQGQTQQTLRSRSKNACLKIRKTVAANFHLTKGLSGFTGLRYPEFNRVLGFEWHAFCFKTNKLVSGAKVPD